MKADEHHPRLPPLPTDRNSTHSVYGHEGSTSTTSSTSLLSLPLYPGPRVPKAGSRARVRACVLKARPASSLVVISAKAAHAVALHCRCQTCQTPLDGRRLPHPSCKGCVQHALPSECHACLTVTTGAAYLSLYPEVCTMGWMDAGWLKEPIHTPFFCALQRECGGKGEGRRP